MGWCWSAIVDGTARSNGHRRAASSIRASRSDRDWRARCSKRLGSLLPAWADLRYSVVVEAPQLGWRLRVEAWEAADVVGDIVVADPDGIVEEVRQVDRSRGAWPCWPAARSGFTCPWATG